MKKFITISGYLLFTFMVFLPIGMILSSCLGYTFRLKSDALFAMPAALLAVSVVVLIRTTKEKVEDEVVTILFSLLAPLSMANLIVYILACRQSWVVISMMVCVGCCCYVTIKHGQPLRLKRIAMPLSVPLVLLIAFLSVVVLAFGDIGQNAVVQSLASSEGTYYAEVIVSDQGALGGSTFVDVYETKGINAYVFELKKKPQRVYSGGWGEFEDMKIYWKNDGCLVINSVEYAI